jgi:hypothetical protein
MKNKIAFYVLSFTWGLPMTTIGVIAAAALMCAGYKPTKWGPCYCFTIGKRWGGVSFGPVMLTCELSRESTKNHEFGHALQNCKYGFLMPFIVSIPSATRYWYRELRYNRRGLKPPTDYDSIWFEHDATVTGTEQIKYWQ